MADMISLCSGCGVRLGERHEPWCWTVSIGRPANVPNALPNPAPKTGDLAFQLPPEVMQYHHDIRRFVEAMIYKLSIHSSKGKWDGQTAESRIEKLEAEVAELKDALRRGNMVEILLEAADVANYALIISAIVMERGK